MLYHLNKITVTIPKSITVETISFNPLPQVSSDEEETPRALRVPFDKPIEVRIKVLLPRENPVVPSVYWIWRTADWQERESYDMFGIIYEGHPNLKRILMPEDWVGWPLRKDYISPDFYELQDAY